MSGWGSKVCVMGFYDGLFSCDRMGSYVCRIPSVGGVPIMCRILTMGWVLVVCRIPVVG